MADLGHLYMAGELRVNRHNGNTSRRPRPLFLHTFFKIPIATQVIFLLALLGFFLKGDRAAAALRREDLPTGSHVGLLDLFQFLL
jgi:hypothetical protein